MIVCGKQLTPMYVGYNNKCTVVGKQRTTSW
jgi:hypothetical protein